MRFLTDRRVFVFWFLSFVFVGSGYSFELDESSVRPGEWGYRPADRSVSVLNPPGFSWRPTKNAVSYEIQIAADPTFQRVIYTLDRIPWSAHCPRKNLPFGKLYWRYRATDKSGVESGWSRVRSFNVNSESVVFPQPTVTDLVARMPESHPRLFFRPEDISRLRELGGNELADEWKDVKQEADRLLSRPPDTTEPPTYPKNVARKGGEWKRIWWGNRTRTIKVVDGAATLAFAYRISGQEKYGKAARDLMIALSEWDTGGATKYSYNDEAAMPILYMGSRAYTWAYPMFSAADRRAVVTMMRTRGDQAFESLRSRSHLWRPYSSHHNRSWHFLGELAVAFQTEIPEAETWLDYAMTVMYTAYPVWGDADGGWHEGASYWQSYTARFMYWAYVTKSAFNIDVFDRPFFRRTGYFGMYTAPPGATTSGFGDLAARKSARDIGQLVTTLGSGARNPHWIWYGESTGARSRDGYLGFLYAVQTVDLKPESPDELPSSAYFRGTGLAVLNTNLLDSGDNVQIHFKSSPLGRQSHGYNSNNSFLLNLRGRRALIRTGRRDVHGGRHHTEWMWHTRSDNAILVNGRSQIKHSPAAVGMITHFETSPSLDVVGGEAGDSYDNLDRWTRRIMFFKPHAVLIHDILEAPEPSSFQWLLHAPDKFRIGTDGALWKGDPGAVDVRFLHPRGLHITQTSRFDPPPAEWATFKLDEWHLTAYTRAKTRHREFVTLLTIDGAEVTAKYVAGGDGGGEAELFLPTGKAKIVLGRDRCEIEGPDMSSRF